MDTSSVSLAAERLNLTQPAISKHLSALEAAVGLRLFDRRRGGPLTPTREGLAFYRSTEAILAGLHELPEIAAEIRDHIRERLRIAATPPMANCRAMVRALYSFRKENPNVRLSLVPSHRLQIEDLVQRGQVELAFALLPLTNASLSPIPLATTRAVAIVSPDHPFADREVLRPEDLVDQTLILPNRQPIRTHIDVALAKQKLVMKIDIEASSAITACRLAAAGLGITICDPYRATAFSSEMLKVITWEPKVELVYGALIKRDTQLSPVAVQLLDHFEEQLIAEVAHIS